VVLHVLGRLPADDRRYLQQQIQSGVSEEALREFTMMFKHYEREKIG